MPRRKPISGKQHKAELQLKRAVKRGDAPAPDPISKRNPRRKPRPARIGPTGRPLGSTSTSSTIESAKRLQSAFIKLPPKFLEETKSLAAKLLLPRPIPSESAILEGKRSDVSEKLLRALTCPKRPKWKYDMTKVEVEKNEEGLFKKWLAATDEIIAEWQNAPRVEDSATEENAEAGSSAADVMPRSPSYFERNLEVWRQLWRVTEISDIILVLLDSRAPLLHFPPSLSSHLSSLSTPSHPLKIILALTKVDITGPVRVAAWTKYFEQMHPGIKIVQVESYQEKAEGDGKQGKKMYEPHLPDTFRARLVLALKEVHEEMLTPPTRLNGDGEKAKKWNARVRREVDWECVLNAGGGLVGSIVGGATDPRPEDEGGGEGEPEYLTIGLIGQPNVGKSSLLNALFGIRKVRASRTPGKTKHFQTHFWTSQVRLVDCPGLVMPNFVPMEMQVLSSILPISRVSAIPSCIHLASSVIPLEHIFDLTHPSLRNGEQIEDKRTWRDGIRPPNSREGKEKPEWTAMDVLIAYADKKGWVTAKAGRSDVMRAGNALLRIVAEGKIMWGFWPPGTQKILIEEEGGSGIWIPRLDVDDETEYESESEEDIPEEREVASDVESNDEDSEWQEDGDFAQDGQSSTTMGRFSALSLDESM